MSEDPRLEAARYRMARIAADDEGADAEAGAASREADAEASTPPAAVPAAPPARNAHERALYVETAIQQAIRMLGDPELQSAYAAAWLEWDESGEEIGWAPASDDGIA